MKSICPSCEKETAVKMESEKEVFTVRGERIEVEVHYFKCVHCGEEFDDPKSDEDPLEKAYRIYRQRHGMMQPEETRSFRKRYGLTQGELGKLLGWGAVTISRYENGALQDEAHDTTLRLIVEPRNLLTLIEENPEALSENKRKSLIDELQKADAEEYSFARIYEERFGRYEPNEYSGYQKLNLEKTMNAMLFFCEDGEGILKTVMNKLLFYADFTHFREYTVSITGLRYARTTYGAVPDKYEHYYALLMDEDALEMKEVIYHEDLVGEKFHAKRSPDLSLFSTSELKILASIKERFQGVTAQKISDLSRKEKGSEETPDGQFISYRYAEEMRAG